MKDHINSVHKKQSLDTKTTHTCQTCSATFDQKIALVNHMKSHSFAGLCESCGATFPDKILFDAHSCKQVQTTSKKLAQDQEHVCSICSLFFASEIYLQNHIDSAHPAIAAEFIYCCYFCDLSFKEEGILDEHQLNCPKRTVPQPIPIKIKTEPEKIPIDAIFIKTENDLESGNFVEENYCVEENFDDSFIPELESDIVVKQEQLTDTIISDAVTNFVEVKDEYQASEPAKKRKISSNSLDAKLTLDCPKCERKFSKQTYLDDHIKYAHDEKKHSCLICNMDLGSARSLRRHNSIYHPHTLPKYNCKNCAREFRYETTCLKHEKLCFEGFACRECGLDFKSYRAKEQHACEILQHNQGKQKTLLTAPASSKCFICHRSFRTQEAYKMHTEKCSVEKVCQVCHQEFESPQARHKHYWKVHELPLCYECDYCGKKCRRRNNILVHINGIHLKRESAVKPCLKCGKTFKNFHQLRVHLSTEHPLNIRYMKCGACGKSFKSKYKFREHAILHTDSFVCLICGQNFMDKAELETHKSIHKKIETEKVTCQECKAVLAHKNALEIHMKIHEKKNPDHKFTCEVCGRT